MKKIALDKIVIFVVVIALMLLIVIASISLFFNKKETIEVKELAKIEKYDYVLKSNNTEYYKTKFDYLLNVLKDNVDEEEYAKTLTQLFISDFYDLNSKTSKNDIGGIQFVYKDFLDDFKSLAKQSIYKTVENNMYGDRVQELPAVTEVFIDTIETKQFKYSSTDEKAYYIGASISYQTDLGYATKINIVLIHSNNKLEVAKMETV